MALTTAMIPFAHIQNLLCKAVARKLASRFLEGAARRPALFPSEVRFDAGLLNDWGQRQKIPTQTHDATGHKSTE